ncbi:hypothetical protein BaRGS_00001487 [Batillaria attramentaria]|uniref:Uncharacterized protein n=1 Tax=Batillaria attramentaria TaxID=370345 RepID=A0ABD0M858_9CAEN
MTSNITDAPNSSVWATDSPTGNGSLDRLVQEGDDGEHHETTWLLVEFPWIPALIVGCCMVVFLSLSFYSHHKRVRRKRELLMDYLFILLNSGNWNRGRSVSILCNTNSIALTELGRSVKIKRKFEKQHSKEDRLSEKYLKDLVANMTHGRKKELTRFVSDPVHRFTRVGGPKSVRKKSLSMGMFESSLGVHGGPLFPYDMGHSLDRGVLLDPSAQPGLDAHSTKFQRSMTDCGSYGDYNGILPVDVLSRSDHVASSRQFPPDFNTTVEAYPSGKAANGQVDFVQAQTYDQPRAPVLSMDMRKSFDDRSVPSVHSPDPVTSSDIHLSVPSRHQMPYENKTFGADYSHDSVPSEHIEGTTFGGTSRTKDQSELSPCSENKEVVRVSFAADRSVDELEPVSLHTDDKRFAPLRLDSDNHEYNRRSPSPICVIDEDPNLRVAYLRNQSADNDLRDVKRQWSYPETRVYNSFDGWNGHRTDYAPRAADCLYRATVIKNFLKLSNTRSLEHGARFSVDGQPSRHRSEDVDFNPIFPGETRAVATRAAFLPGTLSNRTPDTQPASASHEAGVAKSFRFAFARRSRSKPDSKGSDPDLDDSAPRPKARGSKGYLSKTMSTQSTTALLFESGSPAHDSERDFRSFDFPNRGGSISFDSVSEEPEYLEQSDNPRTMTFGHESLIQSATSSEPKIQTRHETRPGITVPREGPLEIVDWKDGRRGHREGHRGPEKGQLETVLSLDSLVRMDSSQGVRYTSNVQRLPRFQVRSGLQRHQQLLARHCSIPGW